MRGRSIAPAAIEAVQPTKKERLMVEVPQRDPSYADDNLIWIDMEMTGLQPEVNRVLEIAAINDGEI